MHAPCADAAAKAEQELRALRQSCAQLTHDRAQAIANIRRAEGEVGALWHLLSAEKQSFDTDAENFRLMVSLQVDLIHQANEVRMQTTSLSMSSGIWQVMHVLSRLLLRRGCARAANVPVPQVRAHAPERAPGRAAAGA